MSVTNVAGIPTLAGGPTVPISIPPGVTAPNLSMLYQLPGIPYSSNPTSLPFGAGASPQSLSSLYLPSTLAEAAPTVQGATSGGGRLAGLLGRGSSALEGFQGPAFLGGTGEMGLLSTAGRVLPATLAGQLATAGINKALPSTGQAGNIRQVLGDAATWAGIGAGVGSVFPGVGTVAGGVSGGIAGGAYGLLDSLFGDDTEEPSASDRKDLITQSAQTLGLDPTSYSTAFDLLTKNGADPKLLSQQLAMQIIQDGQVQKAQAQQQQQQLAQHQMDQRFAMAMQAQAQEFFTPYVNNIVTSGLSQSEALKGLASQLPGPYRDVMLNQAQQALGHSQQLAGAYAAQSALIPGQFMAQAELKREQQLQQLQYQQSVIAAQQGKSAGGGLNTALMQQIQQQGQQQPTATPAG